MRTENFIAIRYIIESRRNKDISNASIIVVVVIALSIIFFISSVSIMNGYIYGLMKIAFEVESFHIDYPAYHTRKDSINLLNELLNKKRISDKILYADLYREAKILLNANGKASGIMYFRAVPQNIFEKDIEFDKIITLLEGKKELGRNQILISRKTAQKLGLKTGNILYVTAMLSDDSPVVSMNRLIVSGIFTTGYMELDEQLAYVNMNTGDKIFKDYVGYNIFIKLHDYKDADYVGMLNSLPIVIDETLFKKYIVNTDIHNSIKKYLLKIYLFENGVYVLKNNLAKNDIALTWKYLDQIGFINGYNGMITWKYRNYNILTALKFEKNVIAFIVILVVFVAALNILTSVNITIYEKQREIGILKACGFSPGNINMIFLLNGIYLGFIGMIIGILSGLLIMNWLNEILLVFSSLVNFFLNLIYIFTNFFIESYKPDRFEIFSKEFYLDKIYTEISFLEILLIGFLTLLFSILASIIPALKAGSIKPIEVIKNG